MSNKFVPVPNLDSLSPVTTKGDLMVRNASMIQRFPVGADGLFLKYDSSQAAGVIASAATGVPAWPFTSQSSTLNPAVIGTYYNLSGNSFTITLPTAASISGQGFIFKHSGTSLTQVYTFNTTIAQTIGGVASGSYALYTNGETLYLVSDGSNWLVQQHQTDTAPTSPVTAIASTTISALTAYVFTVTAANATAGDTYTNNGFTYTVVTTIAGGLTLTCFGTGTPAVSGTLTKATGAGDATITFASRTITGQPIIGTNSVNRVWWQRQSNRARVYIEVVTSAAGTAGAGNYVLALPSGLSFDVTNYYTAFVTAVTQNASGKTPSSIGTALMTYGTNTNLSSGFCVPYNATWFRVVTVDSSNPNMLDGANNYGFANQATWVFSLDFVVSGWQP